MCIRDSSRPATGEPGPMYWQQRADYKIQIKLDEDTRSVEGSETITYTNNSPLALKYIWLQLDQNIFAKESINNLTRPWSGGSSRVDFSTLRRQNFMDSLRVDFKSYQLKLIINLRKLISWVLMFELIYNNH